MTSVRTFIAETKLEDKNFIGTIAMKSEQIALPDGSKMAMGIDDGMWVLIHHACPSDKITCYEYDSHEDRILVDKRTGGRDDLAKMTSLISYFFENASTEDLVTILPPEGKR
jgi:hypothetical protein